MRNVFLIGAVVNRLSALADFSDLEIFKIELSVVESVNNIIKHAYNNERGHDIEVVFFIHCNRITLEICDTGKNLNIVLLEKINESLPPFDPDDIENLPEGGMGISIINQVMDGVAYETANGRNKLILTKFFRAPEATG
jgi:serine/threonine-protein kinase RsbW